MNMMSGICFKATYNFKLVVEWKMDGGIPKWTKEDQLEVTGVI